MSVAGDMIQLMVEDDNMSGISDRKPKTKDTLLYLP